MIRVIISDRDLFFVKGLELIINQFFYHEHKNVNYCYYFNRESVESADIIVLYMPVGAFYLCTPLLHLRKAGCILIIITDVKKTIKKHFLSSCNKSAFFIDRSTKPSAMMALLRKISQLTLEESSSRICCYRRELKPRQVLIAAQTYEGMAVKDIALLYGMTCKTVSYIKLRIKRQFGLKNHQELHRFLAFMYSQNSFE